MFELKPNQHRILFGQPFTTNSHGLRDREYTVEKPPDVYRIAVLGSSIDMGWGVGTEETYVNLLEDWLNAHAKRRGLKRRFEVINFAVAAYSPMQRLEAFRRKALAFKPDMVLYSATMLDPRLIEIHLCDLFQANDRPPLTTSSATPFADVRPRRRRPAARSRRQACQQDGDQGQAPAAITGASTTRRSASWPTTAASAHAAGVLIIPRVGKADAPEVRAEPVARLRGIAAHHAMPVFDLTATFDRLDPARSRSPPGTTTPTPWATSGSSSPWPAACPRANRCIRRSSPPNRSRRRRRAT